MKKASQVLALLVHALARVVLGLAAAVLVIASGLWLWSGTQASLEWAWEYFAQPRQWVAEGLSGSLREGLRARRLQGRIGTLQVDLRDVALGWDPVFLLDGRVRITGLHAARLRLQGLPAADGRPGARTTPPDSLVLPMALSVDYLALDQCEWEGGVPLQATQLAASYHYDPSGEGHRLTLLDARVARGRYRGQAQWADRAPLTLRAQLEGEVLAPAPAGGQALRLWLEASAGGTLPDIDLRANLHLPGGLQPARGTPSAMVMARITPWTAPFVTQALAHWQHLDLATLWPQGPTTDLQGQVHVTPLHTQHWQMRAQLRNAVPGPWNRQRLPLGRVQADVEWREGIALFRHLRADVGRQGQEGRLEGVGQWLAPQGWTLDLQLAGVQPQALHGAWAAGLPGVDSATSAALDGRLQARSQGELTSFDLALRAVPSQAAFQGQRPATGSGNREGTGQSPAILAIHALRLQGRSQAGHMTLQGHAGGTYTRGSHVLAFELASSAEHGAGDRASWQGHIEQATLSLPDPRARGEPWTLQLQAPVRMQLEDRARWTLGAGQAFLQAPVRLGGAHATLAWDPVQWGHGELHSCGSLRGLPLSWLAFTALQATGDMVFDAQWDVHLSDTPRLSARLSRSSGDINLLAETPEGTPARVTAGVREASLTLDSHGDALRLVLRWASERAGMLEGQMDTRLARGGRAGWRWPAQAPLSGRVQARLPRIAAWSVLAPPGWRMRGSLAADLTLGGTRHAPRLAGHLQADDLSLRSVVDGIALEQGRLRARLDGQRVVIDEWIWHTRGNAGGPAGRFLAKGEAFWSGASPGRPAGLTARIEAQLDHLQASLRSDRQVTVSGTVMAGIDPSQLALEADLRVDRARIAIPDTPVPRLGDDVRVRHLPPGTPSPWNAPALPGGRALRLNARVDLGGDTRVSGRGVDTGVQGQVRVTGTSFSQPQLEGTLSAVNGTYTAYGQRLALRRAVLRFSGPYDDPALDVLAVRPDLERAVGMQVTGRAQAPVLRLWSEVPATEAEKLSWLVLGRGAAAGSAETALLEQAALSLLARRAGLGTGGLASAFGLDEFTVRREGEQGAAITLGKRLGRRLYAAYERSLSGALGTLSVFYDLSARLTLRAQAGERTGLDLIYALSYDRIGKATAPVPEVSGAPPAPGLRGR